MADQTNTGDLTVQTQTPAESQKAHAAMVHQAYLNPADMPAQGSAMDRQLYVAGQGLLKTPEGMWNAAKYDWQHPWETAKMVGTSALLGVGMKVLLPESAPLAKLAGVGIATYFGIQAAEPVLDSLHQARVATTMGQLDQASTQFGDATGSFVTNSVVSGVGFGIGAKGAKYGLMSESMDGFANAKANVWTTVDNHIPSFAQKVVGTRPFDVAGSIGLSPRQSMRFSEGKAELLGSERAVPEGTFKGETDPNAEINVGVQLKSKASDLTIARETQRIRSGRSGYVDDARMEQVFGPDAKSVETLNTFAQTHNLNVLSVNKQTGWVELSGKAGDFSKAFDTKLGDYLHADGTTFRGRSGTLSVPEHLAPEIEGVYGMDSRPQARTYRTPMRFVEEAPVDEGTMKQNLAGKGQAAVGPTDGVVGSADGAAAPDAAAARFKGYMPNEVADAYNFPKGTTGKGYGSVVVALGGETDLAGAAKYFKDNGLPEVQIKKTALPGADTSPSDATGETDLDMQVKGAVAPGAAIEVVSGENSDRGFIGVMNHAVTTEVAPGVVTNDVSISWGQGRPQWSDQGVRGMNLAIRKLNMKGIGVYAASGDHGAGDGGPKGVKMADYPAADAGVTAAGGTTLKIGPDGKIQSEIVWNNHDGWATGGGFDGTQPRPKYQDKVVPNNPDTGKAERGIPDASGNADGETGYRILSGNRYGIVGGTSAVAPLLSSLSARLSEALGRRVGPLNEYLYKNADSNIFNDITKGDNDGYPAGKGWDAASGLGSINGQNLLNSLKADAAKALRIQNLFPTPINNQMEQNQKTGS